MQFICHPGIRNELSGGIENPNQDFSAAPIPLQTAEAFIDAKQGKNKDMLTANENIC